MAGAGDSRPRTAAQWCRERRLAVAINMGMFETDRRTNTGYARSPGYVNNGHWAGKYKAALGFGPLKKGVPALAMADLDDPSAKARLVDYGTVIQNLRLIKAGRSVWEQQERRWSEAAVGVDRQGRLLFIFSRYPYTMKELNDILLALPLAIDSAMHMDGGPPVDSRGRRRPRSERQLRDRGAGERRGAGPVAHPQRPGRPALTIRG